MPTGQHSRNPTPVPAPNPDPASTSKSAPAPASTPKLASNCWILFEI